MSAAELEHVRHHLEDCLGCYQVFDFHAELRAVIRSKCREQQLPPGLLARVQSCFGDVGDVAPEAPALAGEPPLPLA